MPLTNFPNGITSMGIPILGYGQDISGTTYFVDNNSGKDGNDGLSLDKPKKLLSAAITAATADVGRGSDRFARRNTIYYTGDRLTETLATAPKKTDVIGFGSCDSFKRGIIRGNHAITSGNGSRWINCSFDPLTAADMFTWTGGAQPEWWNCEFKAVGAATAVSAIDITDIGYFKVMGCDFMGGFTGDVIDIAGDATNCLRICNNYIIGGANDGIVVTSDGSVAAQEWGLIDSNIINVTAETINDGTNVNISVTNNTCISAASHDDAESITAAMAANNTVTDGNGVTYTIPRLITNDT
jgi:hypothetical protein